YPSTDPPELAVAEHMQRRRSLAPTQLGAYIGDTTGGSADPYQAARSAGNRPMSAYASGGAAHQKGWLPPQPQPPPVTGSHGTHQQAAMPSAHSKPKRDINSRHPGRREQHIGDFIIKQALGKGTFSKVCLAEHRATKQKFALKFIKAKSPQGGSTDKHNLRVEREIKLLSLLYHPNIVRIYDVVQNPKFTMIVMEHNSGGELLHHIRKRGRLHESEARGLFRQIVSAMDYTHRNCIIHRDLKMENIMLDHEGRIRIIDYGFANTFEWDKQLDTFCGSPFYAAPEMVNGIKYTGPEVDVWSMGVILFFMLCGRTPFEGESIKVIYDKISRGKFSLPTVLSKDAGHLLQQILTVDPRKRISMKGIVEHPWLRRDFDQPVNNHLPPRPAVVLQPDEQLLQKMPVYKFRVEDVVAALARSDMAMTPMVCIYHLLVESRKRKASRIARRSHATHMGAGGSASDVESVPPEARPTSRGRQGYAPGYGDAPSPSARPDRRHTQQPQPPFAANSARGSDTGELPPFGASQYEPPRLRKGSTASGQLSVGSSLNLETSSPFLRDDDRRNSRSSRFFDRVRKSMPFLKARRSQVLDDVPPFDNSQNNVDGRNRASFFQVPFRRFSAAPSALSLNNDQQQPVRVPSHYPPPPPPLQAEPGRPLTAAVASRPTQSPPAQRPATSSGGHHPRPHRHTDFGPASNARPEHSEHHRRSEPPRDVPYDSNAPVAAVADPAPRRSARPLSVVSSRQVTPLRLHPTHSLQNNQPTGPIATQTTGAPLPAALTSRGSAPNAMSSSQQPQSKAGMRGIFNLRCTMLGPLDEIQAKIERVLKSKAIVLRKMADVIYSCEDQGIRFEVIVETVQGHLHTIKFKRVEGNWWAYKKLTVAISNELQSMEYSGR
ncbi:MAP/microtubule affinity-regulating kinase 4, partial [Coemansia sp. RSA 2131]